MSITGKGTKSIQKKEVSQSRLVNLGFTTTRALHQATVGQTVIVLTSLTVPTGVVNYSAPSPSVMASTNILLYQNNVSITSSISGKLMMNLSYVISGASTITLLYAARESEVFEILIDQNPRTSTNLLDAAPLISTGTLAATLTDFNVGTPFSVGKYLTQQHGAVMVFLDNQLQYRNAGNAVGGVGDYYEVDAGGGLGTLIRFNIADPINARAVSVMSVGALVERPSGSQMAVMESLQGQIDALVPTVADLAGVPNTTFQATPNNVDLKAFGDRVLAGEARMTITEALDVVQNSRLTALEASSYLTATSSSFAVNTLAVGENYADLVGNSVTLSPGTWRISGYFVLNSGTTGVGVRIVCNSQTSAFFASNGLDSTVTPTQLSTVGTIYGNHTLRGRDSVTTGANTMASNVGGIRTIVSSSTITFTIKITSGSPTIYLVPSLNFNTAGDSTIEAVLTAERLYF